MKPIFISVPFLLCEMVWDCYKLFLFQVTDFLFFLSKVLLATGVGCLAYFFFKYGVGDIYKTELNYELVPVLIIVVCSYFIATVFFNVYSTAVDTLFLCFRRFICCKRCNLFKRAPFSFSWRLWKKWWLRRETILHVQTTDEDIREKK